MKTNFGSFSNFKDAKKAANKIGGLVFWWCSYYIMRATEYNESCGTPKYVSKKAQIFFLKRHKKNLTIRRKELKAAVKLIKQQQQQLVCT